METEHYIIIVNLVLFLVIPYLPDVVFTYFIDTYIGATLIIGLILYSIMYGYLVTMSTFASGLSLYVESHKRRVKSIKGSSILTTVSTPEVVLPSTHVLPNEVHPDVDIPDGEPTTFLPKEDSGTDEYTSVDTKAVLPTASVSADVIDILEKTTT